MITIDIKIQDEQVKAMLADLKARAQNLKPAMSIVGQIVRSSVIKNFMQGGRPEKWKPLAESTILGGIRKKDFTKEGRLREPVSRRLRGDKVLIDTARLMNSIKPKAFADRAEVGTNVIYSAIHQFGGKAGRGKKVTIPARPFLMVQDEDWTEIKSALTEYLLRGAK
jgi:phage virion morphogenesis protein